MSDLKSTVQQRIEEEYEKKGICKALDLADYFLRETERGSDLREEKGIIKGELAEATLLCILRVIQKAIPEKTIILKGVFVKNPVSGQVTELDVTFITPYVIYLFECKSYSGKSKELKDKCTLVVNSKERADVYEQNKLHLLCFNKKYGKHVKFGSKPYRIVLYDYASVQFLDKRAKENQQLFPVMNQNTIVTNILLEYENLKQKQPVVNVKALEKEIKLDILNTDQSLSKKHREQLGY